MTRLSMAHGAINLSQGFPDFPAPEEIKEAARAAIAADINQYPITWGAEPFRAAIAAHLPTIATGCRGSTPRRTSPSPAVRPRR